MLRVPTSELHINVILFLMNSLTIYPGSVQSYPVIQNLSCIHACHWGIVVVLGGYFFNSKYFLLSSKMWQSCQGPQQPVWTIWTLSDLLMLSPLVHEYGMPFYLLRVSLMSLNKLVRITVLPHFLIYLLLNTIYILYKYSSMICINIKSWLSKSITYMFLDVHSKCNQFLEFDFLYT